MKGLFVLHSAVQDASALEKVDSNDGAIILVVADRGAIAGGVEGCLEALRERAKSLKGLLASRGVPCEIVLEWGNAREVASACSQRENAEIINRFE